jgi:chromosomal replication initiation ATPase DnaA
MSEIMIRDISGNKNDAVFNKRRMRSYPTPEQLALSEKRQRYVPNYIVAIVRALCTIVLHDTGVTIDQVLSDSRIETITDQRHICIYISRLFYPTIQYKQFATIFNRDHASCIHSVKTVTDMRSVYAWYDSDISNVEDRVILYLTSNKK